MKKFLASILFIASILAPGIAMAQITPANFWKQVGNYLTPWKSTLGVQAPTLNITGTATTTKLCFASGSCQTSAGGSQSPWTSEINADGNNLISTGRVGVGTSSPQTDLHIGNVNDASIRFSAFQDGGGYEYDLRSNGNTFYFDSVTDGAESASPNFQFQNWNNGGLFYIYGDGSFANRTSNESLNSVYGPTAFNSHIEVDDNDNASSTFKNVFISGNLEVNGMFYAPVAVTVSGDLDMGTHDIINAEAITANTFNGDTINIDNIATNLAEYLEIGAGSAPLYLNGNVGIGTTTPHTVLDIYSEAGDYTGGIAFGSTAWSENHYIFHDGNALNIATTHDIDGSVNPLALFDDGEISLGNDGSFEGSMAFGNSGVTGLSFTTDGTLIDFNSPITVSGAVASEFQGDLTVVGTTTSGALELTTANTGILFASGKYQRNAPRWKDGASIVNATTTDEAYKIGNCLEPNVSVSVDKVASIIASTTGNTGVSLTWNINIGPNFYTVSDTLFDSDITTSSTSTQETDTPDVTTIPAGNCWWFKPISAGTPQIGNFNFNIYGYEN